MTKTIKAEYMPGGARRQEMLDKAVDYIRTPGQTQQIKHEFCLVNVIRHKAVASGFNGKPISLPSSFTIR